MLQDTADLIEEVRTDLKEEIKETQEKISGELETIFEENLETRKQLKRIERNNQDLWKFLKDLSEKK